MGILYIYNENQVQYADKSDYAPGSGNGVMRKYRLDGTKGRGRVGGSGSLGIPTDADPDGQVIQDAVAEIMLNIDSPDSEHIRVVIWNVDASTDPPMLGLGVFKHKQQAQRNRVAISHALRQGLVGERQFLECYLDATRSWEAILGST